MTPIPPARESFRLARYLSQERMLLALFALYMVGALCLLWYLRGLSNDTIRIAALQNVTILAEALQRRAPPDNLTVGEITLSRLSPRQRKEWEAQLANQDRSSNELPHQLTQVGSSRQLTALIVDGRGSSYLVNVPIGRELQKIAAGFKYFYVGSASLGLVIFGILGIGALRLGRAQQAALGHANLPRRATARTTRELTAAQPDRSRWMTIVGLSGSVFGGALLMPSGTAMSVLFVAVIVFSLWCQRAADTYFAAVLVTVLTALLPLLRPIADDTWIVLANGSLAIFAVWTVAVLGLWQKRANRAQSLAQAEATQAQRESVQLQLALSRTEAAEAELHRRERLLQTVSVMAHIGGWRLDLTTMAPSWSREVYKIHELDPSSGQVLETAFDFYAPEARPLMERAVTAASSVGTPFDLTLPFITATGRHRFVRAIGAPDYADGRIVSLSGALQDVTEQHELHERLRRASRSSSEGHWDWEYGSEKIWLSATYCELLGLAPQELELPVAEYHALRHPDDQHAADTAVQTSVEHDGPFDSRFRMRCAGGEWRWLRARGGLERNAEGKPIRLAGSVADIHHETLALQDLERLRARFDRAIRGTQDGLWDWDIAAGTLWLSPRFRELLGYDAQSLPGSVSAFGELMHPEDQERIRLLAKAHMESDIPYDTETRMRMHSGEYRWFRLRGQVERTTTGASLALAGSIQDISSQKQAEAARRDAEARLERAIDGSSDALFEWSLKERGADWYSAQLPQLLGYEPDDMPRGGLLALLSEVDGAALRAAVDAHFVDGAPLERIQQIRTRQGELRWYRLRGRGKPDTDGSPARFAGSIQDITGQREAEQALLAAKEAAAEAARAKGSFLANMSHEIRTPMNGVIGMSELLLETSLDSEQREFAEMIRSSASSLLIVINDILDFSKIEAGKLDLEEAPFGLREHLERSVKTLALRAHQKDLELVCHVATDVPDAIIGDPSRLRQIILNLVGNAIKFAEHGEIGVAVRVAAHTDSAVALHFEVSDTGIGIPADKQHLIFEAFTQADGSTCRKFGGTGLGLAICTQLVGMMGGRIWVESIEGQGSTFQFTARFGCSEEVAEGDPADMCGLSVLIVDDNATNRRILEERTRGWGMLPQSVEDGPSALIAIRRAAKTDSPFDLVLLDGHMPGLDGFGVAERIKKDSELTCGSLIMLTSAGEQGESARCRELGVAGYLMKPVAASDLRRVIETVVKDSAFAAPALPAATAETAPAAPQDTPPILREPERLPPPSAANPLPTGPSYRLLLAEDNPVNRTIGTRMLSKLGHLVVTADNGKQAVEISATESFDVVLMDVEMPIMNGFEATAAIRAREAEIGGRRTPIIALTAHVMQGDRERCLDAGMDSYASKPIQPTELFATIEALLATNPREEPMASTPSEDIPVLDRIALYEQVGDEADLLLKVIEMFRIDSVSVVAKLDVALTEGDASEVQQGAHRIKGALLTLGGKAAANVAMHLEHMGREGDVSQGMPLLTDLRHELERLAPELDAVVRGLDVPVAANS